MEHPASRDGLCWPPQLRAGGSTLWSVWTPLADVTVSKTTSLPAAGGGKFFAAIMPCSPAAPEACQGGITTAAGFVWRWHPTWPASPWQEQGHQLLPEPPTALSLFGEGLLRAFPRVQYFPHHSLKPRSAPRQGRDSACEAVSAFAGPHKNGC